MANFIFGENANHLWPLRVVLVNRRHDSRSCWLRSSETLLVPRRIAASLATWRFHARHNASNSKLNSSHATVARPRTGIKLTTTSWNTLPNILTTWRSGSERYNSWSNESATTDRYFEVGAAFVIFINTLVRSTAATSLDLQCDEWRA